MMAHDATLWNTSLYHKLFTWFLERIYISKKILKLWPVAADNLTHVRRMGH